MTIENDPALHTVYFSMKKNKKSKLKMISDINLLVIRRDSRAGAGLTGLSTTRDRVSIETILTALTS